ncbi:MAG: alginate export family protein [Bacteroidales bacterium]
MKNVIVFFLTGMLVLLIGHSAYAQFEVSAEIRPRGEFRRGYKMLLADSLKDRPVYIVTQRTRLNFQYTKTKIQARISIQDVRIWGDEELYSSTGIFGDDASLDVHEAWLKIKMFNNAHVTIGRQEWTYDDQRLLAGRNWNQHALAYDAVLMNITPGLWQIDVGLSWNNERASLFNERYNPMKIRTLNFLYLRKEFSPVWSASVIALANGYQKENSPDVIYLRGTYGGNVWMEMKKFSIHGSGYYQNGKNKTGKRVSAYALFASASYKADFITLGMGADYISGNDQTGNGDESKDHVFDILYGARHKFYGFMDYFSNIPASTDGAGLFNGYLSLEKAVARQHKIGIFYRYFALQNDISVLDVDGDHVVPDRYLATELDLIYTYALNEELSVNAGYSFLVPGRTMEIIHDLSQGDGITGHWSWIMITFKPLLFGN